MSATCQSVLYLGVRLGAEAWAGGGAGHAKAGVRGSAGVLAGVAQPGGAQSHVAARLPQGCPPGARRLCWRGLAQVLAGYK